MAPADAAQAPTPYAYQPLKGKLYLPVDCWELNDFDWEPIPTEKKAEQ